MIFIYNFSWSINSRKSRCRGRSSFSTKCSWWSGEAVNGIPDCRLSIWGFRLPNVCSTFELSAFVKRTGRPYSPLRSQGVLWSGEQLCHFVINTQTTWHNFSPMSRTARQYPDTAEVGWSVINLATNQLPEERKPLESIASAGTESLAHFAVFHRKIRLPASDLGETVYRWGKCPKQEGEFY